MKKWKADMSVGDYAFPQQLLVPCPSCGCTVLRGQYTTLEDDAGRKVQRLEKFTTPRAPVCGTAEEPHDCDTAVAQFLHMQGIRWGRPRR
jgi:hypothetical protein